MTRKKVFYSGQVQGVGFRMTAQRIAQSHPVTGYVRNLPDGRVELVAEGESEAVDAFLAAVADRMSGYIQNTEVQTESAREAFKTFAIRH